MEQRVSLITLGVRDVDAARRFYVEGLGWEPTLDLPGEVVFIQVSHGLLLALWRAEALAEDIGAGDDPAAAPAPPPFALAHNVGSEQEVIDFIAQAEQAGATVLKPAQRASFGGFHGYFEDPAGFRWEVAHNPGLTVDQDGRVSLGPVP